MIEKRRTLWNLKRWILLALTVIGSLPSYGDERLTIRVLSYNIHHGQGVDGRLDLERIARVIRMTHPDLVALQEVDRRTVRAQRVDQPAMLGRLTKMQVVFEQNIPFEGGDYGNAILSRYPVKSYRNHKLPRYNQGEQRGVLETEILLPKGYGRLMFWATHLDHRVDPSERLASARALERIVRSKASLPGVLAGDLNTQLTGPVLPIVLRTWINSNGCKPLPTIPVKKPLRQIDFVLFRPENRWCVQSVEVLDEAVASDHRAILGVLDLLPVK